MLKSNSSSLEARSHVTPLRVLIDQLLFSNRRLPEQKGAHQGSARLASTNIWSYGSTMFLLLIGGQF